MVGHKRGDGVVGEDSPGPTEEGGDALRDQRDSFIHTFFKKGAELTEELLQEELRLRSRIEELELENASLRIQIASEDAIRTLLSKITELEKEKAELLSRYSNAQARTHQFLERFTEIEAENSRLASLYVASYQLHSTLDLRTIISQLRELLAQFVGARRYAVYLSDEDQRELVPIVVEGFDPGQLQRVRWGDGPIGEAFVCATSQWVEGATAGGSVEQPAACIPMQIGERSVGVIVVFSTFEQKDAFEDLDFELFKLLGAHAASALVAARLFSLHGAKVASVDAFLDLE